MLNKRIIFIFLFISLLSVSLFAITKYKVDPAKCIGCGLCFDKCKLKAIKMNVVARRD